MWKSFELVNPSSSFNALNEPLKRWNDRLLGVLIRTILPNSAARWNKFVQLNGRKAF